jgi:hypothetical protein
MRTEPTRSSGLPASTGVPTPRAKRGAAIRVVKAATPARLTRDTRELDREVLTTIARGGLLICETELRYQLARRGQDRPDLLELLADLERRGLIESETHYRLTATGAQRVSASDRPAPRAISSIPWSTPPRPSPIVPRARASRGARRKPAGRAAAPQRT